jgi:acetoin utilization protein AcuC
MVAPLAPPGEARVTEGRASRRAEEAPLGRSAGIPPGGAPACVWDDRFLEYDFGPTHPFSQRSRQLAVRLMQAVLAERGEPPLELASEVPVASAEYLETFHHAAFLAEVRAASAQLYPGFLDEGSTPAFSGCYAAAARIAGGTAIALETAYTARRPTFAPAGGLHHAHPDRASGFCIFNDVALAIGSSLRAGRRVAYIDLDAHHGDGVMYGFYDSGRVLDIDFHQDGRTLFPGTGFPEEVGVGDGAGAKVNIPFPPGAGDATLLPAFHRIVPPLLRSFRPDLIVLQHGADGHEGDPLTHLRYTARSYDTIDDSVLALGRELWHSRVVVTGGGGYRPESVGRVFARAGMAALGLPRPPSEAPLPPEWRRAFAREWGRPAPDRWVDPPSERGAFSTAEPRSDPVGSLEKALGRRFPPGTVD